MHNKPAAVFELRVPKNHKLMVYIWGTLQEMRAAIRTLPGAGNSQKNTLAFFHAPETKIGPRLVVRNEIVGEIHLTCGEFGAGVFAHELQHFISWWSNIKEFDTMGKDWERVSYLAGYLTTQFWKKYYKVFDV